MYVSLEFRFMCDVCTHVHTIILHICSTKGKHRSYCVLYYVVLLYTCPVNFLGSGLKAVYVIIVTSFCTVRLSHVTVIHTKESITYIIWVTLHEVSEWAPKYSP